LGKNGGRDWVKTSPRSTRRGGAGQKEFSLVRGEKKCTRKKERGFRSEILLRKAKKSKHKGGCPGWTVCWTPVGETK